MARRWAQTPPASAPAASNRQTGTTARTSASYLREPPAGAPRDGRRLHSAFCGGQASLGADVLGVELERVAVGLGRLFVVAEPEVGVAEQDARLDAAAAIDRLRGGLHGLGVLL